MLNILFIFSAKWIISLNAEGIKTISAILQLQTFLKINLDSSFHNKHQAIHLHFPVKKMESISAENCVIGPINLWSWKTEFLRDSKEVFFIHYIIHSNIDYKHLNFNIVGYIRCRGPLVVKIRTNCFIEHVTITKVDPKAAAILNIIAGHKTSFHFIRDWKWNLIFSNLSRKINWS